MLITIYFNEQAIVGASITSVSAENNSVINTAHK